MEENTSNVAEELISRNKFWIILKIILKTWNMETSEQRSDNAVTFLHQNMDWYLTPK